MLSFTPSSTTRREFLVRSAATAAGTFMSIGLPVLGSGTAKADAMSGFTPSISANGTANGIVWGYEFSTTTAVLHAYDATTLAELFNSGTLLGPGVKFAIPTVCNGTVYIGTSNSFVAFGL